MAGKVVNWAFFAVVGIACVAGGIAMLEGTDPIGKAVEQIVTEDAAGGMIVCPKCNGKAFDSDREGKLWRKCRNCGHAQYKPVVTSE